MKKLFTFLSVLALILGLCFGICYIAIPNETKLAVDTLVGYLNTPLGIAGGTTITVGLVVGVILKSVYDRYKSATKEDLEHYKARVEELVESAKNYEQLAEEQYAKIEELVKSVESNEKVDYDYLINVLKKLCETSPNKKIKALGKGIEDYGERKETTND